MVALRVCVLTSEVCYSMLFLGGTSILDFYTRIFLSVTLGFSNSHLFILLLLIFSYQRVLLNPHGVSESMGEIMHGGGQDTSQSSCHTVPPTIKRKLGVALCLLGYQVPTKGVIFINSSINTDNY